MPLDTYLKHPFMVNGMSTPDMSMSAEDFKGGVLGFFVQMKRMYDIRDDVQKVRIATENRERGMPFATEGLYSKSLKAIEKDIIKKLELQLKTQPVYVEWLANVDGIGATLAAGWISNIMIAYRPLESPTETQQKFAMKTRGGAIIYPTIRGIGAFPTISKLWKFSGQDVVEGEAPARARGEKLGRNPKLRTLAWKTSRAFKRLKRGHYWELYQKAKQEILAGRYGEALKDPTTCYRYEKCKAKMHRAAERLGREPKKLPCKLHIDNMAARKAVKQFIADLWVKWRTIEGLPITGTYEHEVLQHKHSEEASDILRTEMS